jgi:hypothetical protein
MVDENIYNKDNYFAYISHQKNNFLAYKTSLDILVKKFDLYLDENIKELTGEVNKIIKMLFNYERSPDYYTDSVFEAQERIIQKFLETYRKFVKLYSLPVVDTNFEQFLEISAEKQRQFEEYSTKIESERKILEFEAPTPPKPTPLKRPKNKTVIKKAQPEPEDLRPNWVEPVKPRDGSDPELLRQLKEHFDSKKLT